MRKRELLRRIERLEIKLAHVQHRLRVVEQQQAVSIPSQWTVPPGPQPPYKITSASTDGSSTTVTASRTIAIP